MSKCHVLKPNHKSETLHNAIFLDTETHQDPDGDNAVTHRLWFGWAAHVVRLKSGAWSDPVWLRFERAGDFWEWVSGYCYPKVKLYIFAHNAGFDLRLVDAFHELPRLGFKPHMMCIESPPVIVKYVREGCAVMLLDTLNWWRQSLASIGARLGKPKLTMPAPTASRSDWDTYCKRDVEVILEQVTQWADFVRDNDMGGFASTLAGQSYRFWRHRHMPCKVTVHQRPCADALARSAYHGGRCEAYFIGSSGPRLHCLDINSMYPAVMTGNPYPVNLHLYTTVSDPTELRNMTRKYLAIADVTVETDAPALAVVHDNRLVFPTGRFRVSLTTPEIKWALAHAKIHTVHAAAFFNGATLFDSFIDEVYRLRLDAAARGDTVTAYAWKILLNSLYGKFGQNGRVWDIVETTPDLDIDTWEEEDPEAGRLVRYRQLGGCIQRLEVDGESTDSMPAIAAHVTAYARMLLWDMQVKAGRENVYYTDTDSLWVTDKGLEALSSDIDPHRLGALKNEGTHTDWTIWGPKDYVKSGERKTKGVPKGAVDLGGGRYVVDIWSSLQGDLRRGKANSPRTAKVVKTLKRAYTKGVVGATGRVEPLRADADWTV